MKLPCFSESGLADSLKHGFFLSADLGVGLWEEPVTCLTFFVGKQENHTRKVDLAGKIITFCQK